MALLILYCLVGAVVRAAFHVPTRNGVAEPATPATHCVHVFSEVEQVRADAADLAQARECVSLRLCLTVSCHEGKSEDGRIVLRRATRIADFHDAIDGANTVRLDAAHDRVMVLLHEIAFGDVIGAAFGAEDEEAVEASPVLDLPRV